jgi:hypothetical protein
MPQPLGVKARGQEVALITVVDFAADDKQREEQMARLTSPQFKFFGAVEWIRENLVHWLYDSRGAAVALATSFPAMAGSLARFGVISRIGRTFGTGSTRARSLTETGSCPLIRRRQKSEAEARRLRFPNPISAMNLPSGYGDINWADEKRLYAKPAGVHDPAPV